MPCRRQQVCVGQRLDQEVGNGMVQVARIHCQECANGKGNTQEVILRFGDLAAETHGFRTVELSILVVGSEPKTFNERALRAFR